MAHSTEGSADHPWDIVVVGAGISGINAGYRFQEQVPGASYTILEARENMGGTWDLFKYPGIRSDSDLHTFGFPWRPWMEDQAIADGESIMNYIKESAAMYGIDRKIQYRQKVSSVNWSTEEQHWALEVDGDGTRRTVYCKFLLLGTGYYDYNSPLQVTIPGIEKFNGTVVHPQFWPEDLDYTKKNIIIIGSGATAVTLLPSLAKTASHVTMLQRSPSYLISLPNDASKSWFSRFLPAWVAHKYVRMKFLLFPWLFFNFCRTFPNAARGLLRKATSRQLPSNIPHDPHFEPNYNPWEQRLCVAPDGDFYKSLRRDKTDVVTDTISTVTSNGILLDSGKSLDADIIITATGLKIQFAGGIKLSVDKEPITPSEKFLWRGVMLQDVPNAALVIGYTNASWTLGADATAQMVCRLLNHMRSRGLSSAVPRADDEKIESVPVLNLNSTYVKRAAGTLPKAGDRGPWRPRSNYFADLFDAKFGAITPGLQFYRVTAA